jgi:hypothetical protein
VRFRDYVEVSVDYGEGVADPGRLCLARLDDHAGEVARPLDSYIDYERNRVVAYVDSLGFFGLLGDDDVASPPLRASGVGIGPVFPNPFSKVAVIEYEVAQPGRAKISAFDVRGRLVSAVFEGDVGRGLHHTAWYGEDAYGGKVCPGVYYLVIEALNATSSTKVIKVN